jgi:hypothetical protein
VIRDREGEMVAMPQKFITGHVVVSLSTPIRIFVGLAALGPVPLLSPHISLRGSTGLPNSIGRFTE